MRWSQRLTAAVVGLTGVLLVGAVVGTATAPALRTVLTLAVGMAVGPTSAVLGAYIAHRQPANRVGLLLAAVGLTVSFTVAKEVGWEVLAGRPALLASLDWLVALLSETAFWGFAATALLLLYFPDGTLPSPRWRWIPPTLLGCAAIVQAYGALDPVPFRAPLTGLARPFGPPPLWLDLLHVVAFPTLLALVLACAWSLVVRFRRGDRKRQAQIKWLALAGIGVLVYPPLCLIEIALWGRPLWLSLTVVIVALVGIPVATAVAIVRHDLYDVDKALASTVTWGLLTVVLVGVYAATSFGAGLVFGRGSAAAAAGATAVCALALSPARIGLHRLVDRRLYPLRRAAFTAIETLHRDISAARAHPEDLAGVLRIALRDPTVNIGFRVPGQEDFVDTAGQPIDPAGGVPVVLGDTSIGIIVTGPAGASPGLLRQVAARAATLVEVVRLRLRLAQALREVESSRARLVQTGYDERRRLERDLHDGAQQRLVSLGMALRLAQRHLDDGTVDVDGLLDQSVAELGTAVAELRRIAHGLRPASLDDGLPVALSGLVRAVPVPVEMNVCPGPLPDDVATTAYYVVSEAVANAVKHAGGSRIQLDVTHTGDRLLVMVSDDGCGGAVLPATSGLADRVAALGGSLRIHSPVGHGTKVEATLPCTS